ncbi:hypothetical protein BDZ45DRAFT_759022 [Acephala macrosclerotiorum]|nr:hypothetical protein BDZ45DRAFT_759022 [Acephala macrosclerotiorum]
MVSIHSRTQKIKERHSLAERTQKRGIEIPPCSRCQKQTLQCMVFSRSTRCGACVKRGLKCDVAGPREEDWARLDQERSRLAAEEEAAFTQEEAAFHRRMRIKSLSGVLEKKAGEMIRRGLQSVEELEDFGEKRTVQDLKALGEEMGSSLSEVNSNVLPACLMSKFDFRSLSPLPNSFWESLKITEGGCGLVSSDRDDC